MDPVTSDSLTSHNTHTVSDKAGLIGDSHNTESAPLKAAKKILTRKFEVTDHTQSFRIIVISGVVFAIAVTIALILSIYLGPPQVGANGGVATDVQECSELGLQILRDGGNAVDAAVTASLCIGLFNPQSSGLGGGGFMIVHDHKVDNSWGYDYREVAPSASTVDMFGTSPDLLYHSGLSVGVPGELKGLALAHKKHGKLKWMDVVSPVANLAREGFNVTKALGKNLQNKMNAKKLSTKMKSIFMRNGKWLEEGDFIKRPDLAATLDIIAQDPDALYTGLLATDIIAAVANYNGIMKMKDLANYKVIERKILRSQFQKSTVATLDLPSGGPLLLLMLNMFKGFNWTIDDVNNPKIYHQMIETFKFSYARHGILGDPDFSEMDNTTLHLISEELANSLRAKIDNASHVQEYYDADYMPSGNKGTSHLSVVDAEELVVSVTSTVNTWFGSQIMTDSGILLNNEMADFSIPSIPNLFNLPPNPHNLIEPGKRPLSSMTPAIVYNKDEPCNKRLVLGAANGTKIISGIAEVIANVMVFNLNMTYAIEKPRVHNQLFPDITEYEAGVPDSVVQYLKDRGQNMEKVTEGINIVQGIMKNNDHIFAHSDSRKGGKAAIYFQTTKK